MKYKNIKCRLDCTRDNCTYWPEFKATCPDNCPNRRRNSRREAVSGDYITRLEQESLCKDDIIKKLAEAIVNNYFQPVGIKQCRFCGDIVNNINHNHKLDCPVLLAEQVLKEDKASGISCKTCGHLDSNGIDCNDDHQNQECRNYKFWIPKEDNGMLKHLKPVVDKLRKDGAIFTPPDKGAPFQEAMDELIKECGKPEPSKERFCSACGEGTVSEVKGTEPYSEDYLMCNKCDSTFNKEEDDTFNLGDPDYIGDLMFKGEIKMNKPKFTKEQAKDIIQCIFGTHFQFVQNDGLSHIENLINGGYIIDSEPEEPKVSIEKKHMKLYELQHHVDKLIEQGYSDTPVYFDTEAKTYDYHIVPIGSINLVHKEDVGEDYIIINQYIEKIEQPEIVHNVMKYKGEYYLRQFGDCIDCTFHGVMCHNGTDIIKFGHLTKCMDTGTIWKSFKDIQITDELACMRKDIGDIYLALEIDGMHILKFLAVNNYTHEAIVGYGARYSLYNIRLATTEEIKEYMENHK